MTSEVEHLYAKATARPWEVDSERDTDGPDRHTYYKMFGPDGKCLFDTLNSDVAYLHQEYDGDENGWRVNVWDEQGRANFELVAYAVNNIERLEAHTTSLSQRLEAAVSALEQIVSGDYPRPVGKAWRADGLPSKLDECIHGQLVRSVCEACIDEFVENTLETLRADEGEG